MSELNYPNSYYEQDNESHDDEYHAHHHDCKLHSTSDSKYDIYLNYNETTPLINNVIFTNNTLDKYHKKYCSCCRYYCFANYIFTKTTFLCLIVFLLCVSSILFLKFCYR